MSNIFSKGEEFMYDTKNFSLSKSFVRRYSGKQPEWGPLGYVTFKRTYARIKEDGYSEEFWETLERVVNGVFNLQKQWCKKIGLPWSERKAQNTAQKMYHKMWNFRFLPSGRSLWVMGTEYVDKHGSAAINSCFQYNTEIITDEGIKKIGDCVNTTQKLLTDNGKWVDAPINSFGEQKLYRLTISRQGIQKDIYCTGDHTWYCKDRRFEHRHKGMIPFKTTELRPGVHRLQSIYGNGIKRITPSAVGIMHGICFGDGSLHTLQNASNTLRLYNEKSQLGKYFLDSEVYERDGDTFVSRFPNYYKDIPSLKETLSYLLGFVMGYFATDGSCYKTGQCVISSYNEKNIKGIRDICYKLGIGTYGIQEHNRITPLSDGKEVTCYSVTFMRDTLTSSFFLMEHHRYNFENNKKRQIGLRKYTVPQFQKLIDLR